MIWYSIARLVCGATRQGPANTIPGDSGVQSSAVQCSGRVGRIRMPESRARVSPISKVTGECALIALQLGLAEG